MERLLGTEFSMGYKVTPEGITGRGKHIGDIQ